MVLLPVSSWGMAHQNVRKLRGSARDQFCIDCGEPADEWSYQGGDPHEEASLTGPYSLSVEFYAPRCYKCHRAFDRPTQRSNRSDDLGSSLRQSRKVAGLSQTELAKAIGVTPAFICLVEAGKRGLTPERAYEISCVLGL